MKQIKIKKYFLLLVGFLAFLPYSYAKGESNMGEKWPYSWGHSRYSYISTPNGGKIYCKINADANTATIGAYYTGCRFGDVGREGEWGKHRRQVVESNLTLPERVNVRYCNELKGTDTAEGTFTLVGLEKDAFKNCEDLVSITLPGSVKNIGKKAFSGCNNLVSINLSSNIDNIETTFVEGCKKLKYINVANPTTKGYHSFDGILCKDGETLVCPEGISGTVNIPSNITKIGKASFIFCDEITGVNFGKGVKSIGPKAFKGLDLLDNLVIPGNVEKVGDEAFRECASLSKVTFEYGVKSIYMQAFIDCQALKEVIMPRGLEHLSQEAFKNCFALERVVIPDGINTIYNETFAYCSSLREVTLPNSIEYIGSNAFIGCTALEKVNLGMKVKEISRYAFFSCSSLKSINLSPKTKIYEETFFDCPNLKR